MAPARAPRQREPTLTHISTATYTQPRPCSAFYEACAAVEVDEYRNYEKAGAALKEAA